MPVIPNYIMAVLLVSAVTGLPAQRTVAQTLAGHVLDESFDGETLTDFGAAVLAEKNVSLASGKGVNNSNAIRVDYRGNRRGSERVIVNYALPPSLHYTLSFDVYFCSEFDFRKGGKLHGLGPARPVAGGNRVSPARWSARAMFRRDGGLQTYIYSQNIKGRYGDVVIANSFRFKPGRYYALSYQVALNSPASEANGYMRLYVNGERVVEHNNIQFRSSETLDSHIGTLMFNTFHGGHTAEWAPRKADGSYAVTCAYFDNYTVVPSLVIKPVPG